MLRSDCGDFDFGRRDLLLDGKEFLSKRISVSNPSYFNLDSFQKWIYSAGRCSAGFDTILAGSLYLLGIFHDVVSVPSEHFFLLSLLS